ncbi:hypothetical protein [Motilimonas sp. KMU-193]|uniref:hypothetical protein n=1 Tax=Motilimonas sp. KMU-193 TaxID=3388668 RepID=UPI00396B0ABC
MWMLICFIFVCLTVFTLIFILNQTLLKPLLQQPERYFLPTESALTSPFDSINCWAQNHDFFEDGQFVFQRDQHIAHCASWINEEANTYLLACQWDSKQLLFFVQLFNTGDHFITANTYPWLILPALTQVNGCYLTTIDIEQLWQHHLANAPKQSAYIANTKTYRLLCRFLRKQHASYMALPWWKINYFKLFSWHRKSNAAPFE